MEILRVQKVEMDLKDVKIGDKIEVPISCHAVYTATAQRVNKITNRVTFIFDRIIQISDREQADDKLFKKYCTKLKNFFPRQFRDKGLIVDIPTYGMIFGHNRFYQAWCTPDNDEQFPLMTQRINRLVSYDDDDGFESYWLKNAMRDDGREYAVVDMYGNSWRHHYMGNSGIRPVFSLSID